MGRGGCVNHHGCLRFQVVISLVQLRKKLPKGPNFKFSYIHRWLWQKKCWNILRPPFKRETLWSRTEKLIQSATPIPTSITKISSNFKNHFGSTNNKRDCLQILLASWEKCIIEINLKHFQGGFQISLKRQSRRQALSYTDLTKYQDWLPPKFIKLLY